MDDRKFQLENGDTNYWSKWKRKREKKIDALTIAAHSACQTLLQSTILTTVAMMFCDFTVHCTAALICQLLANGSLEKAFAAFTRNRTIVSTTGSIAAHQTQFHIHHIIGHGCRYTTTTNTAATTISKHFTTVAIFLFDFIQMQANVFTVRFLLFHFSHIQLIWGMSHGISAQTPHRCHNNRTQNTNDATKWIEFQLDYASKFTDGKWEKVLLVSKNFMYIKGVFVWFHILCDMKKKWRLFHTSTNTICQLEWLQCLPLAFVRSPSRTVC